ITFSFDGISFAPEPGQGQYIHYASGAYFLTFITEKFTGGKYLTCLLVKFIIQEYVNFYFLSLNEASLIAIFKEMENFKC
ncbi:MAG TPA: hypothetical protein PL110_17255, partial [Candidatus Eremiobacteraeota bacterium]|nr:hypothetical protein [Candidatus Eremiobacteraeota bacterium]